VKLATRKKDPHDRDDPVVRSEPRIGGFALWFAVLGGVVAWFFQLGISWSVMELSCLGPTRGGMYQQAGDSVYARIAAWAGTSVPWLVALAALVTCLLLIARMRRLGADLLAGERTKLLLSIGLFLDAMTLAIITGSGIGLAFVEAC
jgi:amino acid transporter